MERKKIVLDAYHKALHPEKAKEEYRSPQEKVNIFGVRIPATIKVGEANYYSRSVMEFDPSNKAATAYTDFAKEIMQRDNESRIGNAQATA